MPDREARRNQLNAMRPSRGEEEYRGELARAVTRGANGEPDALKKTFKWCLRTNANDSRLDTERKSQIRGFVLSQTAALLSKDMPEAEAKAQVETWISEINQAAMPRKPQHEQKIVKVLQPNRQAAPVVAMITLEAVGKDLDRTQDLLNLAERYLTRVLVPHNRQIASADLPGMRQLVKDRVHSHFVTQAAGASNILGAIDEATKWLEALERRDEKPRLPQEPRPPHGRQQAQRHIARGRGSQEAPQYKVTKQELVPVAMLPVDQARVAELAKTVRAKGGHFPSKEHRAQLALSKYRREQGVRRAEADAERAAANEQERIRRAEASAGNSRRLEPSMLVTSKGASGPPRRRRPRTWQVPRFSDTRPHHF